MYLALSSRIEGQVLQNDLLSLEKWEKMWDMNFNPSKCQVLHVTYLKTPIKTNYFLHDTVLDSVSSAKYLGVMSDALEEHDGKISIDGRNITNLRFADDIDALAEEEQELEALVESLDKTCTRYKMEISAEKTKLITNSASGIQREIKVKGQKLGTVTSFKYLEAVVSDDGSKPEVLSRTAQATAALTKLKPIWRDNNIHVSLGSKVKLMCSLVIFIFLYACESWTLTAELKKRTQAFEMRCYRRLLNISYKDHVTNEEVRR